jgi:hypothetical protein
MCGLSPPLLDFGDAHRAADSPLSSCSSSLMSSGRSRNKSAPSPEPPSVVGCVLAIAIDLEFLQYACFHLRVCSISRRQACGFAHCRARSAD